MATKGFGVLTIVINCFYNLFASKQSEPIIAPLKCHMTSLQHEQKL